mmetsp:Transcript_16535/g.51740  ORF Transcript_16535/g.51740 Transcript_16535/m.51740 type:complete len:439 (-) Transcript_16535:190-1506(-)
MPQRILLAYSGGLDTSCILKYLLEEGHTVVCFCGDVGQEEDFAAVKTKAMAIGAEDIVIADLKKTFVEDFIFPMACWNAVYETRYLLGTSIARPAMVHEMLRVAKAYRCTALSHGATGKGNDQCRFELAAMSLDPTLTVIAPWRDEAFCKRFRGRSDLIAYAKDRKIPVDASPSKPFSMDENLYHCSYEAGVLEDPAVAYPRGMLKLVRPLEDTPDAPDFIDVHFVDGIPVKVGVHEQAARSLSYQPPKAGTAKYSKVCEDPLDLFQLLNALGREHGVGVIDIVENRFVGIKSRGVYETPGGTILYHAHVDIEGVTMDREVRRLRDMLMPEFSKALYNGFWFSPEMEFLNAACARSQEGVDGVVTLRIYKASVMAVARDSPFTLYDEKLSSMDEEGGYTQADAGGFIAINVHRLRTQTMMRVRNKDEFSRKRKARPQK